MNVNEMKEYAASGNFAAVESAWMAAAEGEEAISPKAAGEVLSALVEAGQQDQAEALGWALLEERKERLDAGEALELAKSMAVAVPNSAELRQQAWQRYRQLYAGHPRLEALEKASDLFGAGTPRRAFATLDLCLRATGGSFLSNRFQNQIVQVRRYDEAMGEYELEDLAGGSLSLEPRKLADEFELIDETDFRVLSHRDTERLKDLFQTEPAAVLIGICQAHDRRQIDSVALKDLLVPTYIEPEGWSGWWNRARTAAKRCGKLSVEGRNPITITYHAEGRTLEQEMAAEVESAKTPLAYVELMRRYVREARQRHVEVDPGFAGRIVEALADQARSYVSARPADALAASLGVLDAGRLGLAPPAGECPSPAGVLASAQQPAEAVAALENDSLWSDALDALAQRPDAPDQLERLLVRTPARLLDEVASRLRNAGRGQAIVAAAARALADPLQSLELCIWLWLGSPEVPPEAMSKLEILGRLLKTLQDLDIDLAMEVENRKDLQRRIRTAIAARHFAVYREVVGRLDEALASILKSRIERTDGLAESVRDEMLKVLRENFYGLFVKEKVAPWLDEGVLWTTARALHRYEAELKELLEIQIPANSRAIGAAAAHGDLSENSEWKFAIEERNKFQARQAKMQDELAKARTLHAEDVPTGSVGVGSRVRLRSRADGQEVEVSLLGPWDTDLEKHWYSYQTALAGNLLGKTVGETASLKLEGDEAEYEIVELGVAEL